MPKQTVKVDRTTKFGNPCAANGDRKQAVAMFRDTVQQLKEGRGSYQNHRGEWITLETIRSELVGRNLACWCPIRECEKCGQDHTGRQYRLCPLCGGNVIRGHCHGDVLLGLANEDTEPHPGEIPLKAWIATQSEVLNMTRSAIWMRYYRGALKPKAIRKVSLHRIYVIP